MLFNLLLFLFITKFSLRFKNYFFFYIFVKMGALTNKLYAYKARPWELESIETISISDPFFNKIKIDMRERQILRILPIVGINEWLLNNTRFPVIIKQPKTPHAKLFMLFNYEIVENINIVMSLKANYPISLFEAIATAILQVHHAKCVMIILGETADVLTSAATKRTDKARICGLNTKIIHEYVQQVPRQNPANVQNLLKREKFIIPRTTGIINQISLQNIHAGIQSQINFINQYNLLSLMEGHMRCEETTIVADPAYSRMSLGHLDQFTIQLGPTNIASAYSSENRPTPPVNQDVIITHHALSLTITNKKGYEIVFYLDSPMLEKNIYIDIFNKRRRTIRAIPSISAKNIIRSIFSY